MRKCPKSNALLACRTTFCWWKQRCTKSMSFLFPRGAYVCTEDRSSGAHRRLVSSGFDGARRNFSGRRTCARKYGPQSKKPSHARLSGDRAKDGAHGQREAATRGLAERSGERNESNRWSPDSCERCGGRSEKMEIRDRQRRKHGDGGIPL